MIIKADKEGIEIIKQMLDLTLKTGGLQNFPVVKHILDNIKEIDNAEDKGFCGSSCTCD